MNSPEKLLSSDGKNRIVKKFAVGYLILIAMPSVVFAVLLLHGLKVVDAVKGALTGVVPFTVFFIAITYQVLKEIRAVKLDGPRDSG